jgi:hypothetical protein
MALFKKEEPDLSEKVCFPKRCALRLRGTVLFSRRNRAHLSEPLLN